MTERIQFFQDRSYQVEFQYGDPREPEVGELEPVHGLHEVTPYGMMLFSLASCTAQVVLGYSSHHHLDLEEVEIRLVYERDYQQDCEDCEEIDEFQERIRGKIEFRGQLSAEEKEKLLRISRQCPIEKIFEEGISIAIEAGEMAKGD